MLKTKVFINNFNLLTWPKLMIEYMLRWDSVEIIIIDNNSTYPPLLDYYKKCPCEIIRLEKNIGYLAPWESGIIDQINDQYYVVTDPDLDISTVPLDCISYLQHGLDKHPEVLKAGLGLEYKGIPETTFTSLQIKHSIMRYSLSEYDCYDGFQSAPIATTFALYDKKRDRSKLHWCAAIMSKRPYVVKHIPYYMMSSPISEEYDYYIKTANRECSKTLSTLERRQILDEIYR